MAGIKKYPYYTPTDFGKLAEGRLDEIRSVARIDSPYYRLATEEKERRAISKTHRTQSKLMMISMIVAAVSTLVGAIATTWPYLAWWASHDFKFR